jgi:threonine dehydrogenase-like Zn-dependent dehydrogenase
VLGAGPIGLYFIALLRLAGLKDILVSEPNPARASMAERSGASDIINPEEQPVHEIIRARTGIGADIVVDAVGTLMKEAVACVCKGGRILLFGMNSRAMSEIRQNDITRNEIQVLGSYIANATFPATVALLESEQLNLKKFVTHTFKLSDIHAGIDAMRSGDAIKVLIDPNG